VDFGYNSDSESECSFRAALNHFHGILLPISPSPIHVNNNNNIITTIIIVIIIIQCRVWCPETLYSRGAEGIRSAMPGGAMCHGGGPTQCQGHGVKAAGGIMQRAQQ